MIVISHRQHKLLMLRLMSISSEIQYELVAADLQLAVIRNYGWLMCGCERPLAARESVIRVESNLTGALCAASAPRPNELRVSDALAGDERRCATDRKCEDAQ